MFGSAALETAIGLAAMFFVLATAASAITEWISRLLNKRAHDLESALGALLAGERMSRPRRKARETAQAKNGQSQPSLDTTLRWLKETSVWRAAEASAGVTAFRRDLRKPSYLSAKMFADAVVEMLINHPLTPVTEPAGQTAVAANAQVQKQAALVLTLAPEDIDWPENLKKRLDALVAEGRHDLLSLKAGLEGWFDEAMERAQGAYKRWATIILFAIGLFLAVVLDLSTIQVATTLWQQPAAREAVVNASHSLETNKAKIKDVASAQGQIDALHIPGGWRDGNAVAWKDIGSHWDRKLYDLVGWLLTAVLVMLGAPFWFDVLSKLVSLRATGVKPPSAEKDGASATQAAATATTAAVDTSGTSTSQTSPPVVNSAITPAGPADVTFAQRVGLIGT